MSEAIAAALVTGGLSLLGVIVTCLATARKSENMMKVSQAVTDTKIEEVLSVDVETGEAKLAFTRDCGKAENEAHDITVVKAKDGSLFHVADYNGLLSVYIRNYIAL